jgi:hypothetical protein
VLYANANPHTVLYADAHTHADTESLAFAEPWLIAIAVPESNRVA